MNGWSSRPGADGWDDEPAWVYEITWEWEPLPGQRYPGDPGRRKAVHTPVYEANRGGSATGGDATAGSPPAGAATSGSSWVPAEIPQRYGGSQRDPREDPSWNRPVQYGGGAADQRRGAAPVYGRGAPSVPVTP